MDSLFERWIIVAEWIAISVCCNGWMRWNLNRMIRQCRPSALDTPLYCPIQQLFPIAMKRLRWIPDHLTTALVLQMLGWMATEAYTSHVQVGWQICMVTIARFYAARAILCGSILIPSSYQSESVRHLRHNQSLSSIVQRGHGNDLIVSGHCGVVVCMLCHLATHIPNCTIHWWWPWVWSQAIMQSILVVVTRCHYAIDVLLAWLLVTCTYPLLSSFPWYELI